ncbi:MULTISPECIES: hydrolase [Methylomonas]|uniref:Hydrolase n=2 Tax=Methylomonas TaxID=416 RepID=A0A140E648_9GAMM|nr:MULTISPECIES: hydrolase [Methylomonas]AMK78872.1 hydrolase [Methylomonas denitrificans]OAI02144.1 hydrolase [Methylomonas methanica]TCV78264.1 nicotinamidase-related amidase [Methylomonas methanica]
MSSHPNLLDADNSVLLVVDIQGRLSTAMPATDLQQMLTHGQRLLLAAGLLDVPVLLTEQYPQGLGPTQTEISECLPGSARIFSKTGFSCCAADGFKQALADSGRKQVVVIGQEAHVCVLQTALELLSENYQVHVLADSVCSRRVEHKDHALRRMQQQGVTLSCHESVLFEWMRDARHNHFKTISALLR